VTKHSGTVANSKAKLQVLIPWEGRFQSTVVAGKAAVESPFWYSRKNDVLHSLHQAFPALPWLHIWLKERKIRRQ